ncbi:MAG: peptidylprolyl isomerase [Gemmatimonadaceae bacterium]|nr:peptidylprolyl isomerase [Gemmatimonadaceae bacterium]
MIEPVTAEGVLLRMIRGIPFFAAAVAVAMSAVAPRAGNAQDPTPAPQLPGSSLPVDRIVAIVGTEPILWSDVLVAVNQKRAQGLAFPSDSAGQMAIARETLSELVDAEILVQKAAQLKIDVTPEEVASSVDDQIRRIRDQFPSDVDYRRELREAGFGTPEEYRRTLVDQARRQALQQRTFTELRKRLRPATVTEEEVNVAFEANRERLRQRPAAVTFRQIVVAPKPSEASKARARAKIDSLLAEIRAGGDFEQIARRESMDPASKELGGDIGWNRRGSGLVAEFERAIFALPPGRVSPIVETSFGYHIIRVDRVQPAEVKARHILIRPTVDSADMERARIDADSVAAQWRRGADFDLLVQRHHDQSEERGILQPYPKDSLPASYKAAIAGKAAGAITDPFRLGADAAVKFAILELVTSTEGGEYSAGDVREQIRQQLIAERATRGLLDSLRRQTFVSLRL